MQTTVGRGAVRSLSPPRAASPRPGQRTDSDGPAARPRVGSTRNPRGVLMSVPTLRPYLAAAGHIVVMPADGRGFAHEHAEVKDADGSPVFALPGQAFGPDLDVHAAFPRPGLYRLWGQFRAADGTVITTQFTLLASDHASE